jgi:hypothetical protein
MTRSPSTLIFDRHRRFEVIDELRTRAPVPAA